MRPSPYIPALRVPVLLVDMAASPERFSVLAKEIKDYILPNLQYRDDRLGIDALAKRFLKSPSALKKIFRSDFRISIHVFIVRQRMQLALSLLREKAKGDPRQHEKAKMHLPDLHAAGNCGR